MTATASHLVTRPYASEDKARLLELLRQVWSYKEAVDKHVEERWWWQWKEPPLQVVADRNNRLVGLCAYLPFTMVGGGRQYSAAWFVDFYVLAEYQGKGLGRKLTQAVQERFEITASLSQTAMAYRVFHKMGWRERVPVPLYVNPLPFSVVFRVPPGVEVVGTIEHTGTVLRGELDALWARLRDAHPAMASRAAADVLRRYASWTGRNYVMLVARQGSECTGYMVVRTAGRRGGAPCGLIVDYLAHPDDGETFGSLVGHAARLLRAKHVDRIYCVCTVPRHQAVLSRHGFLSPRTPLVGRALQANMKWLTYYAAPELPLPDGREWFLTMGDCDIDYAWYQG